jgi:ligand-binding SRPBCC domain-containing protein
MKIYHLKRTQFLPITLSAAWEFFSTPKNLAKITPEHMGFQILYISGGDKAYAGQIIQYKVSVLPRIKVNWVTEITHVEEPNHFKEVKGGIEMTDEVNYAIPFGYLGRLAHWIFVGHEVNRIFDHRFTVLKKYFSNDRKGFLKTA